MKIWIIQDDRKKAQDVQDAIEDFHPGVEVTWLHDWDAGPDKLVQFGQRVIADVSPGDVVIIDLGLPPLGKPYAGLDLFQALYDSPKFHTNEGFTLSVIFDTGSRETEPEIQEAIRGLGLQPVLAVIRQRGRLYWLARKSAEHIARCAVDIVTGSPPRDTAPQATTRSPQEQASAAWTYFVMHDGRNAAAVGGEKAWRDVHEQFRRVDKQLQALEAPDQPFFGEERRQLAEILRNPTPAFPRLCEVVGITLPERSQEGSSSPIPANPPGNIAVIEDNWDLKLQLERHLEDLGHHVVRLIKSQKNLQNLSQEPDKITRQLPRQKRTVDIVVLDLNLWGSPEDGLRILQDIRQKKLPVGVVALTGYAEREVLDRANALKVDGYVLKSSSDMQQQLAEAIQQVLRRRGISKTRLTQRHILVIDDQPATVVTEEFQQRLTQRACVYRICDSPDEIIAHIRSGESSLEAISLVLLDLQFGDQYRGRDLLEEIKRWKPELPVFILTSQDLNLTDEERVSVFYSDSHSSPLRPDDYLTKPLDGDEVAWGKIWAALFREPTKAILVRDEQCLKLLNAEGVELGQVPLKPQPWTFLCYLFRKRLKNREGITVQNGVPESDPDMQYAQNLGKKYSWQHHPSRQNTTINIAPIITRINAPVRELLQRDWDLITLRDESQYVLSHDLKQVFIDPPGEE